ncbi:hypothetical protein COCMIDRAFT_92096 [Bipolaris oryzae ATCC 44560]|uniref:Heterokaryon incompatibility domain-containing protein n=1 Tax=Bipolaris oryzae ATCC 44560 TaxID=930090 RepID=W6ZGX7_COCMI|nr:uncharacterized protein COCMIDRAFT_92096 [Bipolaris oryzae ATCC 44560]EUC46674.1 hypothetical protein COCMIDRAFT_92096 [Bipolaris oryzae ATCC 44560]
MDIFSLSPHSCPECKVIIIDGTGPKVTQRFEFSHCKVKELSQRCEFFNWTLNSSEECLCTTDKLRLSIAGDSEDLKYLNVEWRDEDDEPVSEDDTKRQLYIFSMRDYAAARYIKSRPLEPSPARSVRLGWCLELYEDCLNHETCKTAMERNKSYTAPTRLLDVRQNSELRLCTVPQGEHPPYAALSYCWGTSQQQKDARTTRENVDDRQGRIDISQLPQSIRDAVKVTRRLELSYLWVDAFCIVQNDPKDVELEMSKMAGIYRGATITISAASANDSTEGFLKDRDLKKAYGNLFQLPYHNKRADGMVEGLVLLSEHPVADTRQENIDQRAWTLQEDMLSLRLLRFGSKQTTWRCLTYPQTKKIDGGGCPTLENKDYAFSVNDPYQNTEVQLNISSFGPLGGPCVKADWLETVSEYTRRKLTEPSDRLPACAALAENFADIMNFDSSHYLAGLWKDDIYAQLLWHRLEERKVGSTFSPSWSWSSINGPVQFFERKLLEYDFEVNAAAKYIGSYRDCMSGSHDYSKVGSGRLELNGRLQEAHWDSRSLRRSSTDANVLPSRIYWDVSDAISPQTVWCFEIIGSYISLGLVLLREKQTRFKRVGYFECDGGDNSLTMKSFFDETKPQTIALY